VREAKRKEYKRLATLVERAKSLDPRIIQDRELEKKRSVSADIYLSYTHIYIMYDYICNDVPTLSHCLISNRKEEAKAAKLAEQKRLEEEAKAAAEEAKRRQEEEEARLKEEKAQVRPCRTVEDGKQWR
jgi:hypothetical protein